MSFDEEKTPVSKRIFDHANRVYRLASRIQYTIISSSTINYDEEEIGEKLEQMIDDLHDAAVELENAVAILKEIED